MTRNPEQAGPTKMWQYFPGHYMFSYQLVRILAQAHYGGGEFNECLEAAARIEPGNRESFHEAWTWQGRQVLARAEKALAEGRRTTARAHFLRASNYLRTAEFFLQPGDDRKLPTYLQAVEAFHRSLPYWRIPPDVVKVPYEGSHMPGYFFKAKATLTEPGPLVIMFGGLDSCAEELWFGPALLLNERGVSVLVLDGPGQGGALRLNGLHTRHDYEVPATTAFDWAIANLPVDPGRIGIMAVSMGGYMAARAAAFESRFRACAIWGAVWNYSDTWDNRSDDHPLAPILMHILGVDDMKSAREKLQLFTLDGVAEQIRIPTFISHGEDDRQNVVAHAYRLYEALTCEKHLHIVPKEETGSAHCHVDNFTKAYPMLDWLARELGSEEV
ncbi:prolyl oligopeptidase family serine peptidase [Rhodocaloribacter litoris]|uniref:alpha/beta hydrolase family protein n=1 Tax=Rhodocaloribacter litoris TaxID=2558931 RepID=UPI001E31829C|nr:prolyl oligopeptidase family serine peptidase [Rhodocaloribacter litoris]QXD15393.1 prolyl oligopeptidase family serine peptidase [Rhodocaloribacter litoris]